MKFMMNQMRKLIIIKISKIIIIFKICLLIDPLFIQQMEYEGCSMLTVILNNVKQKIIK